MKRQLFTSPGSLAGLEGAAPPEADDPLGQDLTALLDVCPGARLGDSILSFQGKGSSAGNIPEAGAGGLCRNLPLRGL